MLSAVYFNDKPRSMIDEVNDKRADGALPAEACVCEAVRTQPIPETFFSFGHFAAETLRLFS